MRKRIQEDEEEKCLFWTNSQDFHEYQISHVKARTNNV